MEEIYEELNLIMHEIEDTKYSKSMDFKVKTMLKVGKDLMELNSKIIAYCLWGIK